MRPIKLSICAWGPYPGKVEVDFTNFEEGSIFLVTGPTGAGKTTIFDAICYALYGNVSGENRDKNTVRSDFAAPEVDTYVEFHFLHKGVQYQIYRTPKRERPKKRGEGFTMSPETAVLTIPGEEPIASVNEVNAKIQDIMGINFNQFKQIAMIAQGEFLKLLFSNSEDKVKIFRNLFQTQLYDEIKMALSNRERVLYAKIKEHTNKMDEAVASVLPGDNSLLAIAVQSENKNYEKILELLKEYNQEETKKLKAVRQEAEKLEVHYASKINEINAAKELNENIQQLEDVKEKLTLLRNREGEIEEKKLQIANARKAQQVEAKERMYLDAIHRKGQWEAEITKTMQRLEDLKVEQIKLTEELKHLVEMEQEKEQLDKRIHRFEGMLPLFQQLEVSEKESAIRKQKLEQLLTKQVSITEELEKKKAEKASVTNLIKQYDGIEKQMTEVKLQLQEAKQQYDSMRAARRQYQEISNDEALLAKIHNQYKVQEKQMNLAKESYETKERLYRNAAIGLAARYLEDNQPCPVCGSLEHPKKAVVSHEVPDEAEVEQEKKKFEVEQKKCNDIYSNAASLNGALKAKQTEFQTTLKQLSLETQEELEEAYRTVYAKSKELIAQRDDLNTKQKQKEEYNQKLVEIEANLEQFSQNAEKIQQSVQEAQSGVDELKGTIGNIKLQLPKEYPTVDIVERDLKDAREHRNQLVLTMQQIQTKKEELNAKSESTNALLVSHKNQLVVTKEEVSKHLDSFMKAMEDAGFVTNELYEEAKMTQDAIQLVEAMVTSYEKQMTTYEEQQRMLTQRISGRSQVDLISMQEELGRITTNRQELQGKTEALTATLHGNERAYDSIRDKYEKIADVSSVYGYVKDLEKTAKGQNNERTIFEHYVLAAYFEDILEAANLRLAVMTNSRYELLKVSRVGDNRTTNSLDIEVFDQYTGKRRPVKTLSGGESFKAALSLALGLSDIIQQNAGGIEVDTLFIDEGFGSLDSESLDTALKTLTTLTGQNRLIGIISHVAELKERVENQIVVEKDQTGSKLKVLF